MSVSVALVAQGSSGGSSGGLPTTLIFLLLMVGVFYFLLIRPQQRRSRQAKEMLSELEVGDEIVTIGGIFATIREFDDEGVIIEISPGIEMKILRSAIARRLVLDQDAYEDEDEEEEPEEEKEEEKKEAGDAT